MDAKKVKLVVVESHCDLYKEGDEIVFDGPVINKEKSGALCMTALQALYPYVFAGRLAIGHPVSRLRRRRRLPHRRTMMQNPNRADAKGIGLSLDDHAIIKSRVSS